MMYLHIPFCEQLCPYCSFNRLPLDIPLAVRYFHALREELRIYHGLGFRFESVYVGGGTPTVLPDELASTIRLARELWPIGQLSVETNPNHLSAEMLDLLVELGVDRLSVGVQSFQDPILKAIGRYERYGSGLQIEKRLRSAGGAFATLNVDMIFNFPMQGEAMLLRDLETIKALSVDQVTFYPLMSARNVRRELAKLGTIRHGREKSFYELIWEELCGPDLSGPYRPSSAWCFSRIGRGAREDGPEPAAQADARTASRRQPVRPASQAGDHLIDEYIVASEEYAGLGSGSFGYLQGSIYANSFSVPRYIESLEKGKLPILAARRFSRYEQLRYDFLMKMFGGRLDLGWLEAKYGGDPEKELWRELLFFRLSGGLASGRGRAGGRQPALSRSEPALRVLELSRKGYYLLVILMREFFTGVNNFREACLSMADRPRPRRRDQP